MTVENPRNPRRTRAHGTRLFRPMIHALLVPFAAACLIGAFFTDLAYWRTAEMMWTDFSAWLVSVGFVLGIIALIAWVFDWLTGRLAGCGRPAAMQMLGYLAVLVLSGFNTFVHTRDAWTSVVPWGLDLSTATVIVLLFSCAMSWLEIAHGRREIAG
ncbi:DUF2231 domain-containing protein [Mesorhizobium sp. SP-1A]|uniref:DUF2231 domain-containing protein n=1 Tax=Mesorhizobium sp. SP-1A TaxID=3077840 RepID=UPI0028F706A0|nr:DUF2231 domain-containing protein [Mesorhizobium sp. SP-1A]